MNQSDGSRPDRRTRWREFKTSRTYWLLGLWVAAVAVLCNAARFAKDLVDLSLRTGNIWYSAVGIPVAVAAVAAALVMLIRGLWS